MHDRFNRTYVKDVKYPDEILLPTGNFVLITLGEGEPIERLPFTLFDDLPLDLGQSSAIENENENIGKWITFGARWGSGSRSQLSNRVEYGLVDLIQLSSPQLPVEYLAYIAASPPKVDVILIVGHRILDRHKSDAHPCRAEPGGIVPVSWSGGC